MRPGFLTRSLALLTLAGCGGGESTSPPPPPPPAGPGAPASLAATAGEGQSAAPNEPVAVALSVVVRDGAGRVVPNVAVTFAVDSGGGTIAGASATSGADGVAQAGQWRLGPAEGRQVVSARAGSLGPVKFVATAANPDILFPPQVVPPTGGTVALARPGQPLDGFELRLPNGALTAPATVSLTVRSSVGLVLPAGATALTPLVRILSTVPALTEPAIVRFRQPRQAGVQRVAVLRNAATGVVQVLPALVSDAAGITVALPDLGPPATAASLVAGTAAPNEYEVGIAGLADALTNIDWDTGYRPGVDDWDFPRQPVIGLTALTAAKTIDPGEGMLGTSMWYFYFKKTAEGALWRKFQEAAGIPESNRRGLRWSGVFGPAFTTYWQQSQAATTMNTDAAADPVAASKAQFDNLKVGLGLNMLPVPIPIRLQAGTSVDAPRMAVAFRRVGRVFELGIPDQPGQTFRAEFDADGILKPFQVTTSGGGVFTVTGISTGFYPNSALLGKLAAQWPEVVGGTVGVLEGWPKVKLRGRVQSQSAEVNVLLDPADLLLGPKQLHWWTCPTCSASGYQVSGITDDRILLWRRVSRRTDGTYGAMPAAVFSEANFSAADLEPGLESTSGFAIYQPGVGSSTSNPSGMAWLDWTPVRYRRLPTTLTPETSKIIDETDFTFTGTVQGAPPGIKYRWNIFGDFESPSVVATTAPTLTKRLGAKGRTYVVLTALDGATDREIATDTSKVDFEEKPLSIAPAPLVGEFGTDYELTATYGLPLPANPSWVWDLGDGRVVTTTTNRVTINYPAPSPAEARTYPIKLTLKGGDTPEAIAKMSAEIGQTMLAWKFTSVTTTFLKTGPDTFSDGRWKTDSTRMTRFRDGGSQGGIRVVDRAFVRTGDLIPKGLFLLEGRSITKATLDDPVTTNTFASAAFAGASLTLPQSPKVNAWNLLRELQVSPPPTCTDPREAYDRTGTGAAGRVLGWLVHYCWGIHPHFPAVSGQPTVVVDADVSFTATGASGTITVTYLFYVSGPPMQSKTARMTFQAVRVN